MLQRSLRIRNSLDHPTATLLITAAAYLIFIGFRLAFHSFDPSVFITAGDKLCDPGLVPDKVSILENSYGYDGQFYYRLALDPFTSKAFDFGVRLDTPQYRHQRILYPFVVWLFSFGNAESVPFLMIAVNFAALCLMGWFGGAYAKTMDRHALWGLVFSLSPGLILSLARDLTEILEICLLLGGLLFIRKGKNLLATFFLTLAVLTKETALVMTVGIFFSYIISKWKDGCTNQIKWFLFGVPVLSYCIWQTLLFLNWQQFPALSGNNQVGFPFVGMINFVISNLSLKTIIQGFFLGELLFIMFFALCVILSFGSSSAWLHEKYAWIAYGALMVILTDAIWVEDWGFFRALSDFYILGWVIILSSESRVRIPIFVCSIALWLAVSCVRVCFV